MQWNRPLRCKEWIFVHEWRESMGHETLHVAIWIRMRKISNQRNIDWSNHHISVLKYEVCIGDLLAHLNRCR
jgi:hypothetical protein